MYPTLGLWIIDSLAVGLGPETTLREEERRGGGRVRGKLVQESRWYQGNRMKYFGFAVATYLQG